GYIRPIPEQHFPTREERPYRQPDTACDYKEQNRRPYEEHTIIPDVIGNHKTPYVGKSQPETIANKFTATRSTPRKEKILALEKLELEGYVTRHIGYVAVTAGIRFRNAEHDSIG